MATCSTSRRFFSLRSKYLIDTNELNALLKGPNRAHLKIVNASWHMPGSDRNSKKEHRAERITADTVHFDIDEIVDPDS